MEPSSLPEALRADAPLPFKLGIVSSAKLLRHLAQEARWYLTNGTPAGLIGRLAQGVAERQGKTPEAPFRILDVCASPGGKGLAVWDVLKGVQGRGGVRVVMNDVKQEKLEVIHENLAKFGLGRQEGKEEGFVVTLGDGTLIQRDEEGYDVVIVDSPCSNAGVLSRRPEARWR